MKKRRRLKKTIIAKIIIFICLIGIVYSSYHIIKWKLNVDENSEIKEDLKDDIIITKNESTNTYEYSIDFNTLKVKNRDTIGFIKVNGTNINYVVVKTNNNDYYLTHNFNKNSNIAGWIFADYRNSFDGNDKNIIIYGHSTKDGSMFGTLKNVLKKEWYTEEDNHKILLITEKGEYYYEVFSTYTIEPEDYYLTTEFKSDKDYENFINKLKSRSVFDYKVKLNNDDNIITLSSCNIDGSKRIVLHAKLIKDKKEVD